MSYCRNPSISIFLPTKTLIIFQMSPKWLLKKITDSIVQCHDSYYLNLGIHQIAQVLAKQCPLQGKKTLYHPPKVIKSLNSDRRTKTSKFPHTEGKVWRKSTKKWTIEHVKIFLNIARLTVPVDMYFCQEKKILEKPAT